MNIKPIETKYKGYRFRSRLEARWAVFFDALEEPWEYEIEGFDLGDLGWYLPDFYLPKMEMYVEIKPWEPTETEENKCVRFFEVTGMPIICLCGSPGRDSIDRKGFDGFIYAADLLSCDSRKVFKRTFDFMYNPGGPIDLNNIQSKSLVMFVHFRDNKYPSFDRDGEFDACIRTVGIDDTEELEALSTSRIMQAAEVARGERFDSIKRKLQKTIHPVAENSPIHGCQVERTVKQRQDDIISSVDKKDMSFILDQY